MQDGCVCAAATTAADGVATAATVATRDIVLCLACRPSALSTDAGAIMLKAALLHAHRGAAAATSTTLAHKQRCILDDLVVSVRGR